MTVNTRKAVRRTLRFNSHDEMLKEVDRLAAVSRLRASGNWNLAQALAHLNGAMRISLDGTKIAAPWWLRLIGGLFKGRLLRGPMPAGHQVPAKVQAEFVPDPAISQEKAVAEFHELVERLKRESRRHPHPVFGEMTREEWDELHRRHAELHLSYQDVE